MAQTLSAYLRRLRAAHRTVLIIITEGLTFPGRWERYSLLLKGSPFQGLGALQDLRGEERCEAAGTGAQQSDPLLTAIIIISAHHYF